MLICCEVEVKFSSGVCHDHMRTIQAFTLYQFHVRVLVCDGASSNLAFMKLLCGYEHEQLPLADADDQLAVSASYQNPYEDDEDQQVSVVICPSHLE